MNHVKIYICRNADAFQEKKTLDKSAESHWSLEKGDVMRQKL